MISEMLWCQIRCRKGIRLEFKRAENEVPKSLCETKTQSSECSLKRRSERMPSGA